MRDYSRRDFLRQTTVTLAMAALAARAPRRGLGRHHARFCRIH
ncbi:MAG: twin-arginine translocation signal domain-containing protein [Methyloceanibacter sp.]